MLVDGFLILVADCYAVADDARKMGISMDSNNDEETEEELLAFISTS
jgi:hypothetical protein